MGIGRSVAIKLGTQFDRLLLGVQMGNGGMGIETLYHRDDALLYIAYVMLIWAAPIPADRWQVALQSVALG